MSKQKKVAAQPVNPPSITSLFNLIRSLSQAQKRDFKKSSSFRNNKENLKYLRLFDIVNYYVQSGKSETGLLKQILKHKEFDTKKSLSTPTRHLFLKILESVRTTPEVAPYTNRLLSLMQDINFLYYKGLYDDCYHLIREAMALAKSIDKVTYQLELHIWERKVLMTTRSVAEMAKRFGEIMTEEQKSMEELRQFQMLHALSNDLTMSQYQGLPVSNYATTELKPLMEMEAVSSASNQPLRVQYWYHSSLYLYFELQHRQHKSDTNASGQFENLYEALSRLEILLALSEGKGKILAEEEPFYYNLLIDNYINLCTRLGEFERINRIEQLFVASQNEMQLLRSMVVHRLIQFVRINDFQGGAKYIADNKVAERLSLHEHRFSEVRLLALRYTCGQIYFLIEDYDNASDWLRKIISGPRTKITPLALLASELQHIVSLFELKIYRKNVTGMLSNLRGKLRYAGKSNEFLEELFVALKCALRQKNLMNKDELNKHIQSLRLKIETQKSFESHFGVIMAWLEARCYGTRVVDEVKKYN